MRQCAESHLHVGLLRPVARRQSGTSPQRGACIITRRPSWIALALLVILQVRVVAAQGLPGVVTIDQRYDRFHTAEAALDASPPAARPAVIAQLYSTHIAALQDRAVLRELPADAVDLLFRAASDAAFYTFDRRYVRDMQADLDRLHTLHADELRHFQDLYAALVSVRDFVGAHALLATWPKASSDPAPTIVGALADGSGPSALTLSDDGLSASQQPIRLSGAIDIVVIGHPLCHFSRDAVAAIEADPHLKAIFANRARWLMPQDGRMRPRLVAGWNATHPLARMNYVYRQSDWTAIDTWSTPTFYFFRPSTSSGTEGWWTSSLGGPLAARASWRCARHWKSWGCTKRQHGLARVRCPSVQVVAA